MKQKLIKEKQMQNNKIIIFICLIFFLSGCRDITPLNPNDDNMFEVNIIDEQYDIDEPYDFPLKPGMPEWADLKSGAEMVNALQVPQDILNRMTTRSLLETCLNYPLFGDVTASSSTIKAGMEGVINNFNGFHELLGRKYAYVYLSEKFLSFDLLAVTNKKWTLLQKGGYMFELLKIELLLGQDIVLESASYESKISLLKETLIKHKKMLTLKEYYSGHGYEQIFFLMGNILLKSGNPAISSLITNNKEISDFLKTGRLLNNDVTTEILSIANQAVNQKVKK